MPTNTKVAQAKKDAKAYKLTDGAGLYLEVTPSGGKLGATCRDLVEAG